MSLSGSRREQEGGLGDFWAAPLHCIFALGLFSGFSLLGCRARFSACLSVRISRLRLRGHLNIDAIVDVMLCRRLF